MDYDATVCSSIPGEGVIQCHASDFVQSGHGQVVIIFDGFYIGMEAYWNSLINLMRFDTCLCMVENGIAL